MGSVSGVLEAVRFRFGPSPLSRIPEAGKASWLHVSGCTCIAVLGPGLGFQEGFLLSDFRNGGVRPKIWPGAPGMPQARPRQSPHRYTPQLCFSKLNGFLELNARRSSQHSCTAFFLRAKVPTPRIRPPRPGTRQGLFVCGGGRPSPLPPSPPQHFPRPGGGVRVGVRWMSASTVLPTVAVFLKVFNL